MVTALRQHRNGDPYHVEIDAHGLTLTLQCVDPNAQPVEQLWGLHSMTLSVSNWDSGWPVGFKPHEATASDVVALFSPNLDEVMNMHPMLCFPVEGIHGQAWGVVAQFDSVTRKLLTFSLLRVGPW